MPWFDGLRLIGMSMEVLLLATMTETTIAIEDTTHVTQTMTLQTGTLGTTTTVGATGGTMMTVRRDGS